jgi:hypothetical protein
MQCPPPSPRFVPRCAAATMLSRPPDLELRRARGAWPRRCRAHGAWPHYRMPRLVQEVLLACPMTWPMTNSWQRVGARAPTQVVWVLNGRPRRRTPAAAQVEHRPSDWRPASWSASTTSGRWTVTDVHDWLTTNYRDPIDPKFSITIHSLSLILLRHNHSYETDRHKLTWESKCTHAPTICRCYAHTWSRFHLAYVYTTSLPPSTNNSSSRWKWGKDSWKASRCSHVASEAGMPAHWMRTC